MQYCLTVACASCGVSVAVSLVCCDPLTTPAKLNANTARTERLNFTLEEILLCLLCFLCSYSCFVAAVCDSPINFLINAIVLGLGTGACVAKKTPSDQLYAVRPTLSFRSKRAPFDTRNSMMESDPRFAAPIAAVRPIEFVAFTSCPSSKQSFTASSRDASPSVYV